MRRVLSGRKDLDPRPQKSYPLFHPFAVDKPVGEIELGGKKQSEYRG